MSRADVRTTIESRYAIYARRSALFVVVVTTATPFLFLAVASFARGWHFPSLLPREFSARAWEYLFSDAANVVRALRTSFTIALAVATLAVLCALPAARALAFYDFRGKRAITFLLLLPAIAPPLASTMGVHELFLRYDLTDTLAGVVLVHLIPAVPYATLVLASAFADFDLDREAQARTLGANQFDIWRHVTLPAVAPAVGVAASLAFLISWSQYLTTLLIGGGQVLTLPLVLVNFRRGGDDAITAALSLVFLLPTLGVFIVVAKLLKIDAGNDPKRNA